MAISEKLLEVLCCPHSHMPLREAHQNELERINQLIENGQLKKFDNDKLDAPLIEALITTDLKFLYRIDDEIPIMLPDEAIPVKETYFR